MEPTVIQLVLGSDAGRAGLWGLGGGMIAAIVLKVGSREFIGRVIVGGIAAASAAPYIAAEWLNMEPSSPAYPFLCCSLGILGYQMVHKAIENPETIPVIGRYISKEGAVSEPSKPPQAPHQEPPIIAYRKPNSPRIRVPLIE